MGSEVKMTEDGRKIHRTIKFNATRKAIAKNFNVEQKGEYYTGGASYIKCDVSAVFALRKKMIEEGHKVSFTVLYLKLLAYALSKHPAMNAKFDEKTIEQYDSVNIAVGVAAGEFLFAPVIRDVQDKGVLQIQAELKELMNAVNSGTLTMEQMSGATFTLSSLGMYKVCGFQTVISPGQVATMGIGRCKEEPVVVDGEIVIRPINYFSTNVNHAAIMGAEVCEFYNTFDEALTHPEKYITL